MTGSFDEVFYTPDPHVIAWHYTENSVVEELVRKNERCFILQKARAGWMAGDFV